MRINSKYLVTDIFQTGLCVFLITYYLVQRPPKEQKPDLLGLTEELLWFIAKLFLVGIGLTLCFLASYFIMYLLRNCFRPMKKESYFRTNIASSVTQMAAMYPGWYFANELWTNLLGKVYAIGKEPLESAINNAEEVSVFFCIILCVFWACLSTAIFLFLVAGFANA